MNQLGVWGLLILNAHVEWRLIQRLLLHFDQLRVCVKSLPFLVIFAFRFRLICLALFLSILKQLVLCLLHLFLLLIDDVLFLHGGLTHAFVKYYANDVDYDDTDAVIEKINLLGRNEMWDDASPIWFRPQFYNEKMYKEADLLQVVGHTPVMQIDRLGNMLSCDLFSTYRTSDPIGTQEFLLIDTATWEYEGIK